MRLMEQAMGNAHIVGSSGPTKEQRLALAEQAMMGGSAGPVGRPSADDRRRLMQEAMGGGLDDLQAELDGAAAVLVCVFMEFGARALKTVALAAAGPVQSGAKSYRAGDDDDDDE